MQRRSPLGDALPRVPIQRRYVLLARYRINLAKGRCDGWVRQVEDCTDRSAPSPFFVFLFHEALRTLRSSPAKGQASSGAIELQSKGSPHVVHYL